MSAPDVSVLIPVYNTKEYLQRCFASILTQSIGHRRIEIIAVDDGSTDGSGEELDRIARQHPEVVTVRHQANSGGPAAPLNRCLDRAAGRYVFFVGSDDYLAHEALARLVATADRHGADVVLGRVNGVNGRRINQAVFQTSADDVPLFDSALPWSLSNTKLFRRELIERHGLRYREDLPVYSDQPFTLQAYFHARRISVMADYVCYYATQRADRGNITYRARPEQILRSVDAIMAVTAAHASLGPHRDAVNVRHFSWELAGLLGAEFLTQANATQRQICDGIQTLAQRYLTAAILNRLEAAKRVRLSLAALGALSDLQAVIEEIGKPQHVPIHIERGHAYLRYSVFRKPGLPLPDSLFEITDNVAQHIAQRFVVTAAGWIRDTDREMHLAVTGTWPPADGAEPGLVVATASIADAPCQFAWSPGGDAHARMAARALLRGSRGKPAHHQMQLRVTALGTTGDATVKVEQIPIARALIHRQGRVYRLTLARGRAGRLVIAVVPVTVGTLVRRLFRPMSRRRRKS